MSSSINNDPISMSKALQILYKVRTEKFLEQLGASIRLIYAYEYPVILACSF